MTDAILGDFVLDFASKARVLESYKPLDFDAVWDRLSRIRAMVNTIIAARQCGLAKDPSLKTMACAFSDSEYCIKVIELLTNELPLYDPGDYLEDGNYNLMAETCGMNRWREEEVDELIFNPESYDQSFSVVAFLELINYGIHDAEPWGNCIDFFNWPITDGYEMEGGSGSALDNAFLKRTFKKRGAPPEVYTLVMLTLFPPDNELLNVSQDDYMNDPYCMNYEVTTENVRLLRKMWKQAKPLITQVEPAMKWVGENPWFIPILGEALVMSKYDGEKRRNCRLEFDRLYDTDDQELDLETRSRVRVMA